MHFKLALNKRENYDHAQFSYRPQLDESRDGEIMEMLEEVADYLVDEIEFPRTNAAGFYARVSKALTGRFE